MLRCNGSIGTFSQKKSKKGERLSLRQKKRSWAEWNSALMKGVKCSSPEKTNVCRENFKILSRTFCSIIPKNKPAKVGPKSFPWPYHQSVCKYLSSQNVKLQKSLKPFGWSWCFICSCGDAFIGETDNCLTQRVSEHIKMVVNNDDAILCGLRNWSKISGKCFQFLEITYRKLVSASPNCCKSGQMEKNRVILNIDSLNVRALPTNILLSNCTEIIP